MNDAPFPLSVPRDGENSYRFLLDKRTRKGLLLEDGTGKACLKLAVFALAGLLLSAALLLGLAWRLIFSELAASADPSFGLKEFAAIFLKGMMRGVPGK
ncbi:MAG: hypothetical protein LBD06_11805 [Candidatus Accumulibacter sp.]|nr:hypothetical protein [Accumulibacter sp.]